MTTGLPPVVCSICQEIFIFTGQTEADQLIGAAPCGHTFHINCLNQWLANSSTCPQCRTSTRKKTAIRLFFDSPAVYDSDTASQVATLTDSTIQRLNMRINELNGQLEAKVSALEKARNEAGRLAEHLASSKDLCSKAKNALDEEKSKNKILRQRFDELTAKSDKIDHLTKINETMARKLNILDALQKTALEECEAELDKLLQPASGGNPDMREVMTWLAVTSRELHAAQSKMKSQNDDAKKLRDRLAAEKVRCASLSDELRKRSDELTRCESELKSAEERLKRQQNELAKLRTTATSSDDVSPAVRPPATKPSNSSACRDIFESPAFVSSTKDKNNNKTDEIEIVLEGGENNPPKKSRLNFVASTAAMQEPSPVTPNSVTEFRKLATKALRGATEAPMVPLLAAQQQATSSSPGGSSSIQPPPIRRHYNGLGGHSMTFAFPVPSQNVNNKPKSFLTFPSQPAATKRKL